MKHQKVWLAALLAFALIFSAGTAGAALVDPVPYPWLGGPPAAGGIRIETPADGIYLSPSGFQPSDLSIEIDVYTDSAGNTFFGFTSNYPVNRVIVKASTEAVAYNYYDYGSPVVADSGLHALANESGKFPELSHIEFYFAPGIAIDKVTNGSDGPEILKGEPVTWTYTVTNTGAYPLSGVDVDDDKLSGAEDPAYVSGDIDDDHLLDLDEAWLFSASGTAERGDYNNIGTVVGFYGDELVTDSDPSSYFGADPRITVKKYIRFGTGAWDDAEAVTGPRMNSGLDPEFMFVVKNTGNVDLTDVDLVDDVLGTIHEDDSLAPEEIAFYTVTGEWKAGQHTNVATASGDYGSHTVSATDKANYFGTEPSIQVRKQVSVDGVEWLDADDATGPLMNQGTVPTFRFTVTNTGNVPLSGLSLLDSDFALSGAVIPESLEPGDFFVVEHTGTWYRGQHTNTATAGGGYTDDAGRVAIDSDSDDANCFGTTPGIGVKKYVSVDGGETWVDAETVTGPYCAKDVAPKFKFVVTNTGDVDLSDVKLTDSDYDLSGLTVPASLAVHGEFEVTFDAAWEPGQHTDTATASGGFTDDADLTATVEDTDDANYFGSNPGIAIDKITIDGSASGDGLNILTGEPITWRYTVTNSGNVALEHVAVDDDRLSGSDEPARVSGDVNSNNLLDLSETWVFEADGESVPGSYENVGTATGTGPADDDVDDADASDHFGMDPKIRIVKETNGSDGPHIQIGSAVTWTYEVSASGNVALHDIEVKDDQGVVPVYQSGDDDDGILELDETWLYQATGTAIGGTYQNTGTATGECDADSAGHEKGVEDSDTSCYFGYGLLRVEKLTNGGVDQSKDWTFSLLSSGGSVLAGSGTLHDSDGVLEFGDYELDPAKSYWLQENNVAAGWTSVWRFDIDGDGTIGAGEIVNPVNPDTPQDLGNRRIKIGYGTDFVIPADGVLRFKVDNTYPGGDPRTPGYWKNWSSATGGNQMDTAEKNGGFAEGFWTLDDLLNNPGFTIGTLTLGAADGDCLKAVRVLDKSDVLSGKKLAGDAAYELACNLLAAKLNLAAGAKNASGLSSLISQADTLLVQIGFKGTGSYLTSKAKGPAVAQRTLAIDLARQLDLYNNGNMK